MEAHKEWNSEIDLEVWVTKSFAIRVKENAPKFDCKVMLVRFDTDSAFIHIRGNKDQIKQLNKYCDEKEIY